MIIDDDVMHKPLRSSINIFYFLLNAVFAQITIERYKLFPCWYCIPHRFINWFTITHIHRRRSVLSPKTHAITTADYPNIKPHY